MGYRETSQWNEKNEIHCLIIFKKLQADNFPRGKQMEYCRAMSMEAKLDPSNISAKIGNYKSVAGVNNASNASINTIEIYQKYGHLSIEELEKMVS